MARYQDRTLLTTTQNLIFVYPPNKKQYLLVYSVFLIIAHKHMEPQKT